MVAKCGNPGCEARFLYFGRGQLFVTYRHVDHASSGEESLTYPEFFWLCENCAPRMTLQFDLDGAPMILHRNPAQCDDSYALSMHSQFSQAAFQ